MQYNINHKVWVIEDTSERPVPTSTKTQNIIEAIKQKGSGQRNPSLAYSLSILVWGLGQFYNKQWKLGSLLLLQMINFSLFIDIVVMREESVRAFAGSFDITYSLTILVCGIIYFAGIIAWQFNAWHAYFKTSKNNKTPFKGVKMNLLPGLCSFLIPGWGQMLNGQTKKGFFFQLSTLAGLVSIPFIFLIWSVWPELEASRERLIIEWIFSVCTVLSPVIIVMWLLNIFDAVKVSMNDAKKETLPTRIRYVINRFRHRIRLYGWKNAMLPLIKRNVLVVLLLILCFIGYRFIPGQFYSQQLQRKMSLMTQRGMTVIPDITKKIFDGPGRG